jgi:hypothetical protein
MFRWRSRPRPGGRPNIGRTSIYHVIGAERNFLGREVLLPARVAVRWSRHHHGVTHRRLPRRLIATRPAYAPNPQLGAARMSKPWNARLWLSSTCAVPRQFDEALAKSSAKQINFSRNAGSFVKLNRSVERPESFAKTAVLEDSCKVFGGPRFAVILRASHLAPHAFALTRRWEPGVAEPQMTRKMFATT